MPSTELRIFVLFVGQFYLESSRQIWGKIRWKNPGIFLAWEMKNLWENCNHGWTVQCISVLRIGVHGIQPSQSGDPMFGGQTWTTNHRISRISLDLMTHFRDFRDLSRLNSSFHLGSSGRQFHGIWQCVKTLYPCSSHQNSWDLWMFIPLRMVLIGIDPYPYGDSESFRSHRRIWWGYVLRLSQNFRWISSAFFSMFVLAERSSLRTGKLSIDRFNLQGGAPKRYKLVYKPHEYYRY